MTTADSLTAAVRPDGHLEAAASGHGAEARLDAVLSQTSAGIAQCDPHGHFVFVNDAYCKMLGRSREELLRLRMQDVTHPEDRESTGELFKGCLTTGEPFTVEKRYLRSDGAVVWVNNSVTPIRGQGGQAVGALAMSLETTDKHEAEEARKRAEAALFASEEFSRSIVESSPDCVKVLDLGGTLQFMNANGQCIMEIDNFAVLRGRHWADLWPQEARQEIEAALERARLGATGYFSAFCPTAKGTPKWWDVIVAPVLDADGQPERLISISRDITAMELAKRRTEDERRRLLQLFEQAPGFMAVTRGPEHVFELSNAAYRQTVGGRDIIGMKVREAFPELDGQGYYELFDQVYSSGEPFIGRASRALIQRNPAGPLEEGYFDFILQPIVEADGSVSGIFIQGHEVTEQKRTEQELRAANDELQRFAYIVSHDLRSPLVNIMGFTAEIEDARTELAKFHTSVAEVAPELIKPNIRDVIDTDLPEAIHFIRSSTDKMDRLINAILKLSRQGQRILTPEPVAVAALLEAQRRTLTHQLQDCGAELVIENVPDITTDRFAIDQIFGNLLENAVKYLDPARPGRIVVRGRDSGSVMRYDVEDNGRGIAPKDQDRIFDLFRRAGTQDQPGEGIGLAHVKALVRRLGGTISVSSELGVGSCFSVTLPKILSATLEAE